MNNELLKAVLEAIEKVVKDEKYEMFKYFLDTMPIEAMNSNVASTNGKTLFVGPGFLKYSEEERAGIIIHELWHIIANDPFRMNGKDHELWNVVSDIINNDFIYKQHLEGITLPKDVLWDSKIANMIREQAYDYLLDLCKKQGFVEINGKKTKCGGSSGNGGCNDNENCTELPDNFRGLIPNDNLTDEMELPDNFRDLIPNDNLTDEMDVQKRLKESEDDYEKRKGSGSWLRDFLGEQVVAKLPWQTIVQQYLKRLAMSDYTWNPPRYIDIGHEDPIALPRLRTNTLKLGIAIDTSGSIGDSELSVFLAEMGRLISVIWYGLRFSGTLVLTTDEAYYSQPIPPIPTRVSVIKKLQTGGTDFRPAFDLIKEQYHDNIDLLIYFTDGYGTYPKTPPKYPVLWVLTTSPEKLKESGYYPPFGKAIPL